MSCDLQAAHSMTILQTSPRLNVDVLSMVIDYADKPRLCSSIRLACKLWKSIVDVHSRYYWTAVFDTESADNNSFFDILGRACVQRVRVKAVLLLEGPKSMAAHVQRDVLGRILPMVAGAMSTIDALHLRFECPDFAAECLESYAFRDTNPDRLRRLVIVCVDRSWWRLPCIPPYFLGPSAPHLAHISIDGVILPAEPVPVFSKARCLHVTWHPAVGHFDFGRAFPYATDMILADPPDISMWDDPDLSYCVYNSLPAHLFGNLQILRLDGNVRRNLTPFTLRIIQENPQIRSLHISIRRTDVAKFLSICECVHGRLSIRMERCPTVDEWVDRIFTITSGTSSRILHVKCIGFLWPSDEEYDNRLISILLSIRSRVRSIDIPISRCETLALLSGQCDRMLVLEELSLDLGRWWPTSALPSWLPMNIRQARAISLPHPGDAAQPRNHPSLRKLRIYSSEDRRVVFADDVDALSAFISARSHNTVAIDLDNVEMVSADWRWDEEVGWH